MIISRCVDKIAHEACGSRRGLQVFLRDDGDYDGYCFSCSTYVRHPLEDMPEGYTPSSTTKSEEDIQREIAEINDYPFVTLDDRKLNAGTLRHFGIRIGLSEQDGTTPTTHHYPYFNISGDLVAYKNRIIENKRMWSVGDMKSAILFGWPQAIQTGASTLFITEGELDAAALFQILVRYQKGSKFEDQLPAVVSLPNGVSNAAEAVSKMLPEIRARFKKVVLVFDSDDPGRAAEEEVLHVAPDFHTVKLPSKDANQCLIDGHSKAAATACLFNSSVPKNTRIVWGSSLHEEARKEAEWGYSWPWPKLTEMTRGIRLGETYYIGAGVKMGKSEILNAIGAHCITEHGWKVFMAKPEEANRKTYQMVVGKVAGRIFHDPKIPFDYEAFDEASPKVGDNLAMVNLYQHMGWETLKADITAAAVAGCKAIFIDPITNLTVGMSAAEANEKLQEIAVDLAAKAKDLNVAIFIFCHLRAPENGQPHERGGAVQSYQFAGSRAMMRSCNYMIGLEGNKDPDLSMAERCLRSLVLLEDREFGNTGSVQLSWNPHTGMFREL